MLAILRLSLGHRGRNFAHLAGITSGLVLAALLFSAALAVDNGIAAQAKLKLLRDGLVEDLGHRERPDIPANTDVLLRSVLLVDTDRGLMTVTRLATKGANPPRLAGIRDLPAPGSVLVSPALASALDSPDTAVLRGWLPGSVKGMLPPEALVRPQELAAVAVVTPEELRTASGYEVITSDTAASLERSTSGGSNRFLLALAVIAILIPIGSLVGVSVRLSATRRDRRNATLRLIGATPSQVRSVLVVEALAAATFGSSLGLVLFWLARSTINSVSFGAFDFFARDLRVSGGQAAGVVMFMCLVAGGIAVLVSRRLRLAPLLAQRRSGALRLRWTRSLWLLLGCGFLVAEAALANAGAPDSALYLLLLGGLLVTVIGVVRWTPWLIRTIASGVRTLSPATMVAAVRLRFDPHLGYRVVVGLALSAFAFGYVQIFGPGQAGISKAETNADITVDMREEQASRFLREIARVPGVVDVAPLRDEVARLPDGSVAQIATGPCSSLARQLKLSIRSGQCRPGEILLPSETANERGVTAGSVVTLEILGLSPNSTPGPDSRKELVVSGVYSSNFEKTYGILYDRSDAEATNSAQRVFVETDRKPGSQQAVFAVVARTAPGASATTEAMRQAASARSNAETQQLINAILVGATVIGVVAFSYGVLGMLADRRNLLSVLRAIGMRRANLIGVLAVELAIPLISAVVVSLTLGLGLAALQTALLDEPIALPIRQTSTFLGLVGLMAIVCLAILLTITLRASAPRPQFGE